MREVSRIAKAMRAARVRASNRALVTARKETIAEIRSGTRLKASYVRQKLVIVRASNEAPVAKIRAAYEPVPLRKYSGTRATKRGVSAQPVTTKPRFIIEGGFRAPLGDGKSIGFFQRAWAFGPNDVNYRVPLTGRYSSGPPVWRTLRDGRRVIVAGTAKREKVWQLFGPPLVDLFDAKLPRLQERATEILQANYLRELDFYLGRL